MDNQTKMEKAKPYHHGNLRQALIETGIQYVSDHGDNALSIRKLAALCGVTHTSIYSYFKDKDELIEAMKDYVSEQFAHSLENEIVTASQTRPKEMAFALGAGYVKFFIENPRYYYFIFNRKDIPINLDDLTQSDSYEPFEVFKRYAFSYLQYRKIPPKDQPRVLIDMWATVHGIAGIAVMKGTKYSGDWIQTTIDILEKNFLIDADSIGSMSDKEQ